MKKLQLGLVGLVVFVGTLDVACSSGLPSDRAPDAGAGGSPSSGGTAGTGAHTGGNESSSGSTTLVSSGGDSSSAGANSGTAGLSNKGGSTAVASTTNAGGTDAGGTMSNAGMTNAGGTKATGGAPSTRGTTNTGGTMAAGGSTNNGGTAAAGGTTNVGGTPSASGGTVSTGGTMSAGGSIATGGTPSTGGAIGTSGMSSVGGSSSSGGTSGLGGGGTTILTGCAAVTGSPYFCDDFESGLSNWLVGAAGWDTVSTTYQSATHSITDSPGGSYTFGADNAITMAHSVDLTNADSPILSFWHKLALAAICTTAGCQHGLTPWGCPSNESDNAYVEISTDSGTTWSQLANLFDTSNTSTWSLQQLSLSAYVNKKLKLRFRLLASVGTDCTADGWYIDDVVIQEAN